MPGACPLELHDRRYEGCRHDYTAPPRPRASPAVVAEQEIFGRWPGSDKRETPGGKPLASGICGLDQHFSARVADLGLTTHKTDAHTPDS